MLYLLSGRKNKLNGYVPVLFVLMFFLANASCSAICVSRCRSRFCNISSCCRSMSMAFLGASFRFCVAAPPNQPHILAVGEIQEDEIANAGGSPQSKVERTCLLGQILEWQIEVRRSRSPDKWTKDCSLKVASKVASNNVER